MKFRWSMAKAEPLQAEAMAGRFHISRLLAQCLINRGQTALPAVEHFLQPRLRQLSDPFRLPNMRAAVERLLQALGQDEPVVIFGDYDVDGVTSTALLLEVLERLGFRVQAYLPHRMEEGYGLSQLAVEHCLKKYPAKLLLAVDCGSTSTESVGWLRQQGVDVVVLDHHQASTPPPQVTVLVNPHAAGAAGEEGGDYRELCSAGLAFKLAHALVKRGRELGLKAAAEVDLRLWLDLVALGTIADLVPLTEENRILVSAGLERLQATQRPGLKVLKEVAQVGAELGVYEVGYQLAPRLNASGRLETAEESLRLLLAQDEAEALPLAQALDARNRERQQIERGITDEAVEAVRARFNPQTDFVIVEGRAPWHVGVVGIVASRVVQQFYRPTILVGGDGQVWRGSGRSIAGFDLAGALRDCADLLLHHGGHSMAAGLSIAPDKLELFRARLNAVARARLSPEMLQAPLRLDAEVGLGDLSLEAVEELAQLAPTGQGNPAVQLCARSLELHRTPLRMGAEKQHVKLWVSDGSAVHEAVWWGAGSQALPSGAFDLAFVPQINDYNGRRSVQLKVLDWRQS